MSKKNGKENPKVNSKKVKGIKSNGSSEEGNEIKSFIIIVIVLVLIIGVVYGLTILLKKEKKDFSFKPTPGEINYNEVVVGTILNRPYDNYYVLVYDTSSNDAIKYSTLLTDYQGKEKEDGYIKIYLCDLDDELNKKYYNVNNDNKSNPKAKETNEFDFGDITLLHIKKGKITEYIEDYTTIQEKLK